MDTPTPAQKMAARASRFPVHAWGEDGRSYARLNGPIAPGRLISQHMWTDRDMATVEDIARKYPDRIPHGFAAVISEEIGCAPKTFLNRLVKVRKALVENRSNK